MQSHVLPEPRIAEEVGQLLAKPIMGNLRAFSRSVSFIRGLLRSEHVWTKKYGSFRKTRLSSYNTARKWHNISIVAILILTRLLQLQVYRF